MEKYSGRFVFSVLDVPPDRGALTRFQALGHWVPMSLVDDSFDDNPGERRRTSANGRFAKTASISGFLNAGERPRTCEFGLWHKRRSRVRAPSVTLSFAGKTQLSVGAAEGRGSSRSKYRLSRRYGRQPMRSSRTLIFVILFNEDRGYRDSPEITTFLTTPY